MKYLTANQYAATGDFPITAMTPLVLARMVERAEADIDAFMRFDPKLGGFEPGTHWVQAPWDGQSRKVRVPNFPVPIRRAVRYQIQVSTQSTSGAGFMATISPNDIAYNVFDFYAEIVPLQSITYALTPVLIQLGLDPPIVQWDYSVGFYLPYWGERLVSAGDNVTYYAARGFWAMSYDLALSIQPQTPPAIPPVVYVNGQVANPSTYTLDPFEGVVTFPPVNGVPQRQPSDQVTLDYCGTIPDEVRGACIDQVTYILGQAALNRQGLTGIDMARSGQQQIKRTDTSETGLCKRAADKLEGYRLIGVA